MHDTLHHIGLLLAISAMASSCTFLYPPVKPEREMYVDAQISFSGEDGAPAAGQTVYIIERLAHGNYPITQVATTDAEGRVFLRGFYCDPTLVAVDGGSIALHKSTLQRAYEVIVSKGGSLEHNFGTPRPSQFVEDRQQHAECR